MEKQQPDFIIKTRVKFLSDQSDENDERYVFTYTITIKNNGPIAARLISRHWIITDGNHQVQEVKGAGVVGEQPMLQPDQSYEYSSGTILNTQVGTMRGSYQMQTENGDQFDIEIPQFVLSIPRVLH